MTYRNDETFVLKTYKRNASIQVLSQTIQICKLEVRNREKQKTLQIPNIYSASTLNSPSLLII